MIIEKEGQKYIKIGDKAIPFDEYDERGLPKLKPKIETVEKDGKVHKKIVLPALRINFQKNE